MKTCLFRFVCGLVAVFCIGVAQAQDSVPAVINFQGELYDPSASGGAGGPMTGVQQVEFRIYDNLSGGTLIWGRTFPVFCNAQGVFNVLIGDSGTWLGGVTNSLRSAFQGANRYLELTVQGHGSAIAPRQQFVSSPYAMHSAYSTYADVAPSGFEVDNGLRVTSGGADITGNVTVHGASTFAGNATVNGALGVNGTSTFAGNASVSAPYTLSGYGTIPIGGIIMWSGAQNAIPDGWALCDGGNGTPDLRNRFVVGAGSSYAVRDSGGADSVTLTAAQMPTHAHSYKDGYYVENYGPSHAVSGGGSDVYSSVLTGSGNTDNDNYHIYWRPLNSDNNGSSQSHENRPPYFALCFIMRTK